MGRFGQLSLGPDRRPHLGESETHVEVRLHRPAGPLRRLRVAHRGGHVQLQPRSDRRLPAQRHARRDRRHRKRVRRVPPRRSAVLRDHDESLCVRPLALLLRLRAGRLAGERQAHRQLRRAVRIHAAHVGRSFPRRVFQLQSEPAEPGGGRAARRVGVRGRRAGPHRKEHRCTRRGRGVSARDWALCTA